MMKRGKGTIGACLFIVLPVNLISCERPSNPLQADQIQRYHLCYNRQDDHWQIYLNNIDGHAPLNISNNPLDDAYDPLWSPDGKYIAFRYDREQREGCDVYLYDTFTKKTINITAEFGQSESASPKLWSPDGKKLIYDYHKLGEPYHLYVMNSDGSQKTKLAVENGKIIAFYNDSYHFIYDKDDYVYRTDIDGSNSEVLMNKTTAGRYRTWIDDFDPSSEAILCHEDTASWTFAYSFLVKTYNLRTGKVDTIAFSNSDTIFLRPRYSNDHKKVAFVEKNRESHVSRLMLWENNTKKELVRLTNEKEWFDFHSVAFSPYDRYLAYSKNVNNEGLWVSWQSYLYVVDINTREIHSIDKGIDAHWNPLAGL